MIGTITAGPMKIGARAAMFLPSTTSGVQMMAIANDTANAALTR